MLNSSDPQYRILSGSTVLLVLYLRELEAVKERMGPVSFQSIFNGSVRFRVHDGLRKLYRRSGLAPIDATSLSGASHLTMSTTAVEPYYGHQVVGCTPSLLPRQPPHAAKHPSPPVTQFRRPTPAAGHILPMLPQSHPAVQRCRRRLYQKLSQRSCLS